MVCKLVRSLALAAFLAATSALGQPARTLPSFEPAPDLLPQLLSLPAPPPDWQTQARSRNAHLPNSQRDWFEGKPPDDAPLLVLLAYWADQCCYDEDQPPELPEALRERLLQACEQAPGYLSSVLCRLPETPDACERVKALFEKEEPIQQDWPDWSEDVHMWLVLHCQAFHDELIDAARRASDKEGWVRNDDALRRLAERDWRAAQPILSAHLAGSQPLVAALSLAVLYERAIASQDSAQIDARRQELQRLAEDRGAPGYARDLACETLLASDWAGHDEWFLSLFADPTINVISKDGLFFPLASVVRAHPDYWVPRIVPLVNSRDRPVRSAAVRCLEQFHFEDTREDALRPLLPWLSDAEWVKRRFSTDRLRLIQSLDRFPCPEAVPGLIRVTEQARAYELAGAAESLAAQGAREAIPVLEQSLERETEESYRRYVIGALLELGAFTMDEVVAAIEAYAAETATEAGRRRIERARHLWEEDRPVLPVQVSVGRFLALHSDKPNTYAVQRLLERVRILRGRDLQKSQSLWSAIRTWAAKPIDREIVRRIAAGQAEALCVRAALERRASFRANVADELLPLYQAGGTPTGIAAILLEDRQRQARVLDGSDREAQAALLACACLIRTQLPIEKVGPLLERGDPQLICAAERYLESEDSAVARRLLLSHYPGEARILGARWSLDAGHFSFDALESRLRHAVQAEDGPDSIFALLSACNWGDDGQRIIYVRGDEAELRWYTDDAESCQRRKLPDEEWHELRTFISRHDVDALAPLNTLVHDGMQYEFVHLTRNGGRRVYMNAPYRVGGSIYDQLTERFTRLTAGWRTPDPDDPQ